MTNNVMRKVLIIEDDQVLLEMYKDKFIHEKFDVQTARDGNEGLEVLKTFAAEIILLDLIMPHMNGFDFLKKIKSDENLKSVPVLVLTNIFADSQDLIKNAGVDGVLIKAVTTPEQVLDKVYTLLSIEKNV
jgi:CheY-like chemotaxis protein